MKTHTEYLWFNTEKRTQFINITDKVQKAITNSGIKEGLCHVNAMHITSGVYINDAESGLISDIQEWVEKLAPGGLDYQHHQTGEDNADAHLKRMIIGHEVTIPVTEGKADFGPWEQVYYAEFDGQRKKRIIIKTIGE
jgi:secondary thiamine-phosphate synthase enzyme